jgi:hypothetical protein
MREDKADYGSRGSFISRATRRRSRLAREGATKIHHERATDANSAATPSTNCQPVPIASDFASCEAGERAMLLALSGRSKAIVPADQLPRPASASARS